jgi:predicted transcriptional regulator
LSDTDLAVRYGLNMSQLAAWPPQVALMSIRPVYADRILRGEKRFEIRRRPVRLSPDALVLIYSSAPVKAVVGAFTVKQVHVGSPEGLWRKFSDSMGVAREAYRDYLQGVDRACAIEVSEIVLLPKTPLADLRAADADFRPPQSYMFLGEQHASGLGRLTTTVTEHLCVPALPSTLNTLLPFAS